MLVLAAHWFSSKLRGRATEIKGRKVVVAITLAVDGQVCAQGEVVAVQVPESLVDELLKDQ